MKRSLLSLPVRTRWEALVSGLLVCGILGVLSSPSPHPSAQLSPGKPLLFQVVESDYLQPRFASAHEIMALNSAVGTFAGFGGYDEVQACLRIDREILLVNVARFAGPTLLLLGVEFLLRESSPSALTEPRLFISEDFWERAFQRNAAILGTTLCVNTRSYRIAGVTKRTTTLLTDTDIWLPLGSQPAIGESVCFRVIGGIDGDVNWKEAQRELARKCGIQSRRTAPRILPIDRVARFTETQDSEMLARNSRIVRLNRAG